MLDFGVREVAISKAVAAPGWAYVPDTGVNPSAAALQPSSRKRARNQPSTSFADTSAKQELKILREIAALDRENHRDVSIPVPVRHRDNAGRVSHGKVTPNVRKILQSQKTFANYLDDYEALNVPSSSIPTPSQATPPPGGPASSNTKRAYRRKDGRAPSTPTPLRNVSTPPIKPETANADVPMADAEDSIFSPGTSVPPPPHPGDSNPLLVSRIPSMPTQEEIEKLLAAPPLSYNEARGPLVEEDRRKPVQPFCEVCGYWGRIRCIRCGSRVCALDCLQVHQEDCFTRYGA
ncbi:hypothetical protein F5884DRAFT_160081 [Xylogone sp. PMI_703]|nr:hypothetical protein F5884DRAFT_160081 [Xylogone sp. PMI_703]